jgi:hypothetical protein
MVSGEELQIFREQHGGELSQPVPQAMDQRLRRVVILPIRLNALSAEISGAQGDPTQTNALDRQEIREQNSLTDKGIWMPCEIHNIR